MSGRLGLPVHHVHYRAGQPAGTELLAPEDIQVPYYLTSRTVAFYHVIYDELWRCLNVLLRNGAKILTQHKHVQL